ncbi:MAG TPA: hypothetical protein PKE31_19235 [Pseudomonadota bacterium]|nr:hypothetical protein [Pseudomonadota bacterium]
MMVVFHFIREAGWPVFTVLAAGGAACAVAIRMMSKPTDALASLCRNLAVLTVLLGVAGTLLGLHVTVDAIKDGPAEQRWFFLIGLKESLNNLLMAVFLLLPTVFCYMMGRFKQLS